MGWTCDICVNACGGCVGTQLDRIFRELILTPITLVLNCNKNVDILKDNLRSLGEKRQSVQHDADEANLKAEKIEQEVRTWMAKADNYLSKEAETLRRDLEYKAKSRSFMGLSLNPVARYKLSKKAKEDAIAVNELVEHSKFSRISYFDYQREEVAAADDGLQDFDSRSKVLKEIMDSLKDPSIKRIGLHGMAGVGKTTLAKEVKRRAQEEKLFDAVVLATVTKTPDDKRIRADIARDLHLPLSYDHGEGWLAALQVKVRLQKSALVILDDVWTQLDLWRIGIPLESTKLKILLTSRDLDVLSRAMRSTKNIKVGQLQDEEAWKLFADIVGADVERCDLQQIPIQIVQKCGGLPLAIVTLGNALKGKESHVWHDALQRLKTPSPGNFKGSSAEIYSAIEISYSHLEEYGLKETLLLCSFLGHGASIELLVKYAVGLHLFDDIDTIKATRNRVLTFVGKLIDSALLLDVHSNSMFGIHDVVRDVAIAIASRDNCGLCLEDKRRLDMEELQKFNWIYSNGRNIQDLLDRIPIEFPQLTLFIHQSRTPSIKIPESFLEGMQNLQVLDLAYCHLYLQPPLSISLQTNLHSLCLWNVELKDVTTIGELQNLEVLCIGNLDIEELPIEVGNLSQLKSLDLCNCYNLKVIPPNVLSNLSRLEELYFPCNFHPGELEENANQRNASLSELAHLHNLTALEVCIHDVRIIPVELSSRLERYMIYTGECPRDIWRSSLESSRVLKLEMNEGSSIITLLKKTELLHLENLKGVKNVVHELDSKGFQELKHLWVKNAPEIQCLINSPARAYGDAFPILEVLNLYNLINLEKIYYDQLGATSFSKLRIITVKDCNKLKNLFMLSTTRQLQQLQEIEVEHCNNMVEIIDEGQGQANDHIVEATDEKVELRELRSLRLNGLSKLKSFCHGNQFTNDPSTRGVPLFNDKVVFQNLEMLVLSRMKISMIYMSPFCSGLLHSKHY